MVAFATGCFLEAFFRKGPENPNNKERTSPFLRRDAFGDAEIVPIFYNRGKGGEKILHCVICRRPQIIKFNSEF